MNENWHFKVISLVQSNECDIHNVIQMFTETVLEPEDMKKFLREAEDGEYLFIKVVVTKGLYGV